MKKRLEFDVWINIMRNTRQNNEEIEILWLDGADEFVLACDTELFEDGFKSEQEAIDRLSEIENRLNNCKEMS